LLGFCSTLELQLCNHIQIWPCHFSNALSEHGIVLENALYGKEP
jgi:hypothetical protein